MTDDPTFVRQAYEIIDESITFHKAIKNKEADAGVWRNVVLTKKGGVRVLEAMLELEPQRHTRKRKTIQEYTKYWKTNYSSIRKEVYKCD